MRTIILSFIFWLLSMPAWAQQPTPPDPPEKKSLEERIEQLEKTMERTVQSSKWYDRIQVSGRIEVEAANQNNDFKEADQEDERNGDVDLATVELAFDAKVADHVDGHILLKYEDDELFVDEGFFVLAGGDALPVYLIAGRQYVPFGNFETYFITDPNTLILGETNEGAVVAGYHIGGELLEIAVGAFNGRAKKSGDDDVIDSFVAAVKAQPLKGLYLEISYTSNLAGSDSFSEEVQDPDKELDSLVGAWSAFVTFEFLERFKLIGEYVGAIDKFKAGEIYDAGETRQRKPAAWNVELGVGLIDNLSMALRYGGSDEGGSIFLPEAQYGAVVNWGFFKNSNLALEYLHGAFEDQYQETDTVTAQLAIEF